MTMWQISTLSIVLYPFSILHHITFISRGPLPPVTAVDNWDLRVKRNGWLKARNNSLICSLHLYSCQRDAKYFLTGLGANSFCWFG